MNEYDILTKHYESHDEEGRLLSKHGSVEYITTQKYIHELTYRTSYPYQSTFQ